MMNICFINTNKAWGGGEKWHYEMSLILKQLGHNITVITNTESELAKKLSAINIKTEPFNIGKLSFLSPLTYKKIKTYFLSNKFDAIIMNLPSDVKAFSRPAKKSGIKKIIYRRGMNHPIKPSLLNKFIYKRFVTDIIANSEDVKKSISKFIPELEDKTTVIFNGIKIDNILEASPKLSNEKILIGNLGRLVEQKGQKDLIILGKKLKETNTPFHIYIAGDGPLKETLQNEINEYDLSDSITLLGMVPAKELFKKIDLFLFTSRFEGLSNALLEALQFRKPIICYDTASNSEIVFDYDNGFLIKALDIEGIKNKVIELHSNTELYKKMQENSKLTLLTKFDQDKMIQKLEELIK